MCVGSTWQDLETRRRLTRRSGFAGSRLLGLGVDRIGFERHQGPTRRLSSRVCARRDPSDDYFNVLGMKILIETLKVPNVVSVLSTILERLAERNDAVRGRAVAPHHRASAFHGLTKPSISVRSYLERIFRYAGCSLSCYVAAYIYLDRFLRRHPAVSLHSLNVHRFLITSILAAVKFVDDM
ncbi:hypothetical protein BHE74_00047841 [Ensete ventricosum]|nr:hypothetical protein BHE74_00047841 [Ensete ventricosum]